MRDWNLKFPIGTEVVYRGKTFRTWSPAGLGKFDEAAVWLEDFEWPVPLRLLTVPGWVAVNRR